jgi:ribose 1,5-bisphosphokinase
MLQLAPIHPINDFTTAHRGTWVFVCGPSGAGKDSVIAWARERLAMHDEIVFARRMITRPHQQGSDHEAVSATEFRRLVDAGAMAWHWQAHSFGYGISKRYALDVAQGRTVVVNGSREHVQSLPRSPQIRCVAIRASREKLIDRLRERGREASAALAERRRRNERLARFDCDLEIVNDSDLADAGARLQEWLESLTTPA